MSEDRDDKTSIIISKKYINHILNETKKKVAMSAALLKSISPDTEIEEWLNYNGKMALLAEYYAGTQSLVRIMEEIIVVRESKSVDGQEGYPLELGDFSLVDAALQGIAYCQIELATNHNITFELN